jgi:hypothetical protein
MNAPTMHTYAKASMLSGLIGWGLQHQPEISLCATIIGIIAGLVSIWKGLRGK